MEISIHTSPMLGFLVKYMESLQAIIILEWSPLAVRLCHRRIYPTEFHHLARRSRDSRLYALSPTASTHPNLYTYESDSLLYLCALSSTEEYRPPCTLFAVGECQSSAYRALYSTRGPFWPRELRNARVCTSVSKIGVLVSKCALACGRGVTADLRDNAFHGKLRSHRQLCWSLRDD